MLSQPKPAAPGQYAMYCRWLRNVVRVPANGLVYQSSISPNPKEFRQAEGVF
jgi:hypothetical protein